MCRLERSRFILKIQVQFYFTRDKDDSKVQLVKLDVLRDNIGFGYFWRYNKIIEFSRNSSIISTKVSSRLVCI